MLRPVRRDEVRLRSIPEACRILAGGPAFEWPVVPERTGLRSRQEGDRGVGSSARSAPEPLARFCARLKRLQEASGLSQAALARELHVSEQTMSEILTGKIRRILPWDRVQAIVEACYGAADARSLPPDLADRGAWRGRYSDLERDLEATAAPDRPGGERPVESVTGNGSLLTSGGHGPRVGDVDPKWFGIHPAIEVARQPTEWLPPYVRRDLDPELDELLRHSGLVVILGRSAAGKSRTAFEAIRRGLAGHELLVPRDAQALRTIADSGITLRNTVIWLDELDRFLRSGIFDRQLVERLCPQGHCGVVIVATMRSQAMLELTTTATPAERALAYTARVVLDSAAIRTLDLKLSEAERQRADALRHDARISEALDHGHEAALAEYLCAGPAIVTRWRHGREADEGAALVGAALTSAAVCCRRAGCAAPLPRIVLAELYTHLLDSRDAQRYGLPGVDEGLVWATELVRGASSCLVSHEGDRYRAFEYLVDSPGRRTEKTEPVPDLVWDVLLHRLDPEELNFVAIAAHRAGKEDVFRRMMAHWADSIDDPGAWSLTGAVLLFSEPDDGTGERAADAGRPGAARNPATMSSFFSGPGDGFRERAAEAEPWLVRAAEAGHHAGTRNLAIMFDLLGDAAAAERWAHRGAELGDGQCMVRFGEFCADRGKLREAEHWYRKAAETEPVEGRRMPIAASVRIRELGPYENRLMLRRGDYAEEICAPLSAIGHLAALRTMRGDFAEAERLLRRAADHGQMDDLLALAYFLLERGKFQELGDWCKQAARLGRFDAVLRLEEELAESGNIPLAQRIRAYIPDAWRTEAGVFLGGLASSAGDYADDDADAVDEEPYLYGAADAMLLALKAVAAADETNLCVRILGVISMLSDLGVSRELVHLAGSGGVLREAAVAPQAIDEAISRLADSSLVTSSDDGSLVTAHRFVMRVVREQLAHDGSLTALGDTACAVLLIAAKTLADPWRNRRLASNVVQHAIALHHHLAPHLADEDRALAVSMLNLRGWALSCLIEFRDSAQWLELGEQLVADSGRMLGDTHPETLRARNDLGNAYLQAGEARKAITLLERTLGDEERARGNAHPRVQTVRINLAAAYLDAGRAPEAVSLLELTLADRTRALGKTHPDTLLIRSNLAAAYRGAARLEDAIPLLEQTLADLEQVEGARHPHTLIARSNLASLYRKAGRREEALRLHERVLGEAEQILGHDDATTDAIRRGFAAVKGEVEEGGTQPKKLTPGG
jgi:tetratricopeptide (TPR) repeat protein/transcriptional regulator with XRE-family HTH domain